jgi:threonine/homoserine/homoserine lactone efflux protein
MFGLVSTGFLIGVLVSAPMGPVGILCVQRTLSKGRWHGFVSGLGAVLSDVIYAAISGLSVGLIMDIIDAYQKPIEIAGCIVLGIFGLLIIRTKPDKNIKTLKEHKSSYLQDFVTSFLLTMSNVLIVLLFLGLFANFTFALHINSFWEIFYGLGGIAAGAVSWWFVITYFVSKMRRWFNYRGILILNRTIGIIILTLSIAGLVFSLSSYS